MKERGSLKSCTIFYPAVVVMGWSDIILVESGVSPYQFVCGFLVSLSAFGISSAFIAYIQNETQPRGPWACSEELGDVFWEGWSCCTLWMSRPGEGGSQAKPETGGRKCSCIIIYTSWHSFSSPEFSRCDNGSWKGVYTNTCFKRTANADVLHTRLYQDVASLLTFHM